MGSPGLIELARTPTPERPLPRLSAAVGADLWVKRDDLTGFGLSGNKVRKLERLLADAMAKGADTVITCGGKQSNHCRATAIACRQLGLEPVLLLRGLDTVQGHRANLLLDRLMGATLHSCTPDEYRELAKCRMRAARCPSPAISKGRLFLRMRDRVASFDLRGTKAGDS